MSDHSCSELISKLQQSGGNFVCNYIANKCCYIENDKKIMCNIQDDDIKSLSNIYFDAGIGGFLTHIKYKNACVLPKKIHHYQEFDDEGFIIVMNKDKDGGFSKYEGFSK